MIHSKIIFRIIGFLLFIEAACMLPCLPFSIYYQENDLLPFLYTIAAALVTGSILLYLGRKADKTISRRDGHIVVSVCWIVFSLFGAAPYYFSGYIPSITDAFFETMSGFTTTGASILNDIEAMPHGLLFWRSLTQWIGGLGIVIFTIAILPIFGVGDVHLFAAEATGPIHGKLHPRIAVTARWILSVYVGLTLIECFCLMGAGMSWFDAVCHSLTTTSTGGYSTKQASIAAFNSPSIEYIITLFMFVSGINFTLLYYSFMKGKIRKLIGDTEFRTYVGIVLVATAIVTVTLFLTTTYNEEQAFRTSIFQVVSLITTTGYASANYMSWIPFLWLFLAVIMFFGACAGSTTGGMKCVRLAILWKIIRNEFFRIVHPNAVMPVRMSGTVISPSVRSTVLAFSALYFLVIFSGWLAMMLFGLNFMDAFGVVVSSVSNVGPGLGNFGPDFSWAAMTDIQKWIASFLMLLGRLELFSILLVFTPTFWKKQ